MDGQEKEHPGCFSWAEKPRWGQVLAEVYIMSSEVLRRPWKRDIEYMTGLALRGLGSGLYAIVSCDSHED